MCVAQPPEGQAAAAREASAPMTSEQALQQARAEGLTLLVRAESKTGYFGVYLDQRNKTKYYMAQVSRGSKSVGLGYFATAEEAALCIARSPEGQAAAKRAAASEEGQGRATAMPSGAVLKEEGAVPPMPLGAVVKEEEVAPPMPSGAVFKEEGVIPPMPLDAVVKAEEHEVVIKGEERSHGRPKRQRNE